MPSDPYDGFDAGDLLENLAEVVPLVSSDHRRLVEDGRKTLAAIVDAALEAPGAGDGPVADLLGDPVKLQAVGMLAHLHPREWAAFRARVSAKEGRGQYPVSTEVRRELVKAMKEEEAAAKAKVEEAENRRASAAVFRFLDSVRDLSVPKGLRAPYGYTVDQSGIRLNKSVITSRPIVPLGYLRDVETGEVLVHLAWTTPNRRVVHDFVPRTALDEPRALKAAAPMLPLVPEPKALTCFFAAFEDINGEVLPIRKKTARMGWHGREFVVPTMPNDDLVLVVPRDKGEDDIVKKGFGCKGTLDGWKAHYRRAPDLAKIVMLAAACTPILEPAACPGFVVDLSGRSSGGKSVAQRAAATVWGPPHGDMFSPWNTTMPAIMSRAGVLHSLPVILDDTKKAPDPKLIADTVYNITDGKEKERGHREGGQRKSGRWRTVLISSGEKRITYFSNDQGTRGRTLTFWQRALFEADGDRAAGDVAKSYLEAIEDYGLAGPAVVSWCTENWEQIPALHKQAKEGWRKGEDGTIRPFGNLGVRLLDFVAVLDLAAQALDLASESWGALRLAAECAATVDTDGDVHLQAFRDLVSVVFSEAHLYWDGEKTRLDDRGFLVSNDVPVRGSRWRGRQHKEHIFITAPAFAEIMERLGHDARECRAVWKESGWCCGGYSDRMPVGTAWGYRIYPEKAGSTSTEVDHA